MPGIELPTELQEADFMYKWPLIKIIYGYRISYVLGLFSLKGKRVLDAGCGHGVLLYNLLKYGAVSTGADFSQKNLDSARKNLKKLDVGDVKLKKIDLTKIPFPANSFDLVFSLDVLEHISKAEKAIKEIRRILKPGGHFIVSAPTENIWYVLARFVLRMKKPVDHYWDADQINEMISKNFEVEKLKNIYPIFNFFRIIVSRKKLR